MCTLEKRISMLWIQTALGLLFYANTITCQKNRFMDKEIVDKLVRQWAPLVWLAPNEKFMPGSVDDFLLHVHPEHPQVTIVNPSSSSSSSSSVQLKDRIQTSITSSDDQNSISAIYPIDTNKALTASFLPNFNKQQWSTKIQVNDNVDLPVGQRSADWFLVTNDNIDDLLADRKSFVYGQNPSDGTIPIYAIVSMCNNSIFSKKSSNDIRKSYNYVKKFEYAQRSTSKNQRQMSDDVVKPRPRGKRRRRSQQFETDNIIEKCTTNTSLCIFNNTTNIPLKEESFKRNEHGLPHFHVTYWMFYPFSQGKKICTISLGPLGHLPIPMIFGMCMGTRVDFGNHVGDWEHMSLFFRGNVEPEQMYVSAHDAGAYYSYERLTGTFEYRRQETRKGILQQPVFPKTVITSSGYHPVMFSAEGSHGLWTAPGKHRFVRVPRLFDINGFGTPWLTWKNVEISYDSAMKLPNTNNRSDWLQFNGRWGNPKSKCHPLKRVGLNFCEYIDGPTGIPQKKPHFYCNA